MLERPRALGYGHGPGQEKAAHEERLKSREETPKKGSRTATPSLTRNADVILCTAPNKLAGASALAFRIHLVGSVHFRTRAVERGSASQPGSIGLLEGDDGGWGDPDHLPHALHGLKPTFPH